MATYERVNEKTPHGGDYSEIFYFDDDENPIEAEKATKCVIRECDRDGNLIQETFGFAAKATIEDPSFWKYLTFNDEGVKDIRADALDKEKDAFYDWKHEQSELEKQGVKV